MIELSFEISSFLKNIHYSSGRTKIGGFPGDEWRGISFDDKIKMFKLNCGYYLDGFLDSCSKSEYYYFSQKDFLPIINDLKNDQLAKINSNGIYVLVEGTSDHSGGTFEDYSFAFAQKGIIKGDLRLKNNLLDRYQLDFKPTGEKKELQDNFQSFIGKEIIEKLVCDCI